jgi:hypothetical protein
VLGVDVVGVCCKPKDMCGVVVILDVSCQLDAHAVAGSQKDEEIRKTTLRLITQLARYKYQLMIYASSRSTLPSVYARYGFLFPACKLCEDLAELGETPEYFPWIRLLLAFDHRWEKIDGKCTCAVYIKLRMAKTLLPCGSGKTHNGGGARNLMR